jgi:uncharacterized protein YjbI with pentapeptide repeats
VITCKYNAATRVLGQAVDPTSSDVTVGAPSAETTVFFDDFSNPALARYYEVTPGIGNVVRRTDGIHYDIVRAPDGPASAADCLSIDSLGRPHSSTAKILFRFSGSEWTCEACVEYDFRAKRNGRTAHLWIVHGDAAERYEESITLVRGADLDPNSHSLTLKVHETTAEPRSIELARTAADKYWLRVTREGNSMAVSWSADGQAFEQVLARTISSDTAKQTIVINSSSFAGGASFVLRSLRLEGAYPDPIPESPPVFAAERSVTEIPAADIVAALQAGRDIDLRGCTIAGSFDLGQVASPISSHIHLENCRVAGTFVASSIVSLTGSLSCLNCEFGIVGLSNVEFDGPLSMVGCRFTGDTRFIDTHFRAGANFSGSVFSERPFFRVMHATRPVSFYHATFAKGGDLSSASFDDLSLSDIRIEDGSLTLYRSEVTGTLRLMATLQRDPQPLGREVELSSTHIGYLVISSGDQRNRGEYTGPARWEFAPHVYLRRATVDSLEFYNVHFAGVVDLSGATLRSKDIYTASFADVVGGWPVETEFYSCFISYSSKDAAFASRLHAELEKNGVRCWYAPEDIKIGEEFRQTIDDAIREYDKLLLVLSDHSVRSSWVQDEVEACLERERRQQRQVLFPIRLDEAVTDTHQAWAAAIRRRRHIGDFTRWRDQAAYDDAFQRLLRDLKAPKPNP